MLTGFGILLVAFASIQPLHFPPLVSWHSEVFAFLGVLVLSVQLIRSIVLARQPNVQVPWAAAMLSLLALLVVIQSLTGAIDFLGDAVTLIDYVGLCVLAITIGSRSKFLPFLGAAIASVATLSVVIALTQALGVWDDFAWIAGVNSFRRPGANLAQPNQLGTLIIMGMASTLFLYESKRLGHVLASVIAMLLVIGLTLTESRTAVLSLALLAVWALRGRKTVGLRMPPSFVAGMMIGLIGLLWWWPNFITHFYAGGVMAETATNPVNTSVGTRFVVWPQLIEAVLQRPWSGWGLREVSKAHNAVLDAYPTGEAFTYAHNILLDLAVGVGIPLTLLMSFVVAFWLWKRVRAANTLSTWFCLALVLPLAVHSMLEFPFAYAYLLVPAMLVIGVLESELAPQNVTKVPTRLAIGVFTVLLVSMAWSAVEYVQVEEDFRVARFEALRVGHTPPEYGRPSLMLLTQYDALLAGIRIVPKPGMDAESVDLCRRVALRFPWVATQYRYALSLALNDNPSEAVRQLKVMRAMHGEKSYQSIKTIWQDIGLKKYPQLALIQLP